MVKVKSDVDIAQAHQMKMIQTIALQADIHPDSLELYGNYKAKVRLDYLQKKKKKKAGKLILVTAITPTKAGEGKTTTTIGIGDALNLIKKKTIICLREPSLGPVFGIKGGAAGGGYSQVVPMEDINLHFTGDLHAITTANNLVSACIDNHLHFDNELKIDPSRIIWKRALDMNDRALRKVQVGLGNKNGPIRQEGFQISVATEIMAILCLAKDLEDFKTRLSKCVVAYNKEGQPITIKDLKIEGAIAVLMKDAINPNLVQSLGGSPVLMHGGPFANIAHGCNSLIATKMALSLTDYVITEAGFGADLGAEKFLNIKCQEGDLQTSFVVIVATIRALKMHGGVAKDALDIPNSDALQKGIGNLEKHVENIGHFQLPFLVAINRFPSDSKQEIAYLTKRCKELNIPVFVSDVHEKGGKGAKHIAKYIAKHAKNKKVKPLYQRSDSLENKIDIIAKKIYGAKGVNYSLDAINQLALYKKMGFDDAYICMAKTPNSLSDNEKLLGRPVDFEINVSEVRLSAGANFVIPLTGSVMVMPGLPKKPAAEKMDIDHNKIIKGLF